MILCEKCNNYIFPECDEDGIWSAGCKNPNLIDVFMNFFRKNKCRYYSKISYEKMLKETKTILHRLTSISWIYRDRRYPTKFRKFMIWRCKTLIQDYLEYRDFLFNELKEGVER